MKSRFLLALFTLFALSFSGCGQKSGFSFFSEDRPYERAIGYTKKGEIIVSMENKAFLIATYLNPIYEKYNDGEYFFVRVYIDNDFSKENMSGLHNPKYHLLLNGNEPLEIKRLSMEDPLVKEMPMVKPWYKIYLVKFPKESKKLNLVLKSDDYGQTTLTFSAP